MIRMNRAEYVKKCLREEISQGKYSHNSQIPVEADLSKMCNVGRSSVREAISSLVHEGLLLKIQGKGTFINSQVSRAALDMKKSFQVGFAFSLYQETSTTFDFIQDYVLQKGGILTTYNISIDNQDPEKEKMFLEKVEMEKFAGVILVPSPIEPHNTRLYRRLRENNVKVALIEPYADNMDNEVTFFYDYFQAGYLATLKMGMAGYKNICFARHIIPPSYRHMRSGIAQAANDMNLNFLDDLHLMPVPDPIEVPKNTGIITPDLEAGRQVYGLIMETGRKLVSDIGLCTRSPIIQQSDFSPISSVSFSEKERLASAVDYIFDESVLPTEIIHRTFKHNYQEYGTVNKETK